MLYDRPYGTLTGGCTQRFRSMKRMPSLMFVLLCADGICVGMAATPPLTSFHRRTRAAPRRTQHALPSPPHPPATGERSATATL